MIVLVDEPSSTLYPDLRGRFNLRFAPLDGHSNRGLLLPGLFTERHSGLYKSLQLLASKQWHLDLLCGEEEYLPMNSTEPPPASSSRDGPSPNEATTYGALDPQAFLYLVSSFVWEHNMRHLENETRTLSFLRLRTFNPRDAAGINNALHDNRTDLNFLIQNVTETETRMPTELADYYDAFPRIRRRHKATYLSPADHHKNILVRARELERLLIDSFQMLMSSVSVHQAAAGIAQTAASVEQARAATRVTYLAFVYIPLTFVTGIFGMNIRVGGDPKDGFVWFAPLVAFAVAIFFTVGLWFAASWVEHRLSQRRRSKESDIEYQAWQGLKAKYE